jgi:8-oxo-dGTP pyrophosphatase MutT (NUDIX family)/phosphohistidine phosphatase SixA
VSDSGQSPVLAAGAICWRIVDKKVRILLVHRTQHKDVSLPKGKVEPGEMLPQTAVREIAEETGLAVALNAPLGQVEYKIASGRDKVVYYWSAEVDGATVAASTFAPNDEIESLEWVSIKKARKRLTYPHDIDILDVFADRLAAGRARTFALIVLRHGKAVPPTTWQGSDATRPLLERGTAQATGIAPGIAAFRPKKLITSSAARCVATIAPLGQLIAISPTETDVISQEAFESGASGGIRELLEKRIKKGKTTVLCSHGPVIPEIIAEIAGLTNTPPTTEFLSMGELATGEFSVLHIATEHPTSGIVALETHSPVE